MTETPEQIAARLRETSEPVKLEDVIDALNTFNRPKPSEDDGPWEAGHFIRVDFLPAFINIIAAAWFRPKDAAAALEAQAAQIAERDAQIEALRADALRYRWLRARPLHPDEEICIAVDSAKYPGRWAFGGDEPELCDAAIDAAMAAKEPR